MADELRTFAQLLQHVQDGDLHVDLTNELRDLVASLENVRAEQGGKPKGSIVLKLDFTLDSGVFEVVADYAIKAPKIARSKSHFWATPDNLLTKRNPKQAELPLRTVGGDDAAVRTA
jgi:hypothetical protein